MKNKINFFIFALVLLIVNCSFGSMRLGNSKYKIYHEKYGKGGVVNSRSISNRYISAGCEDAPISSFASSSNRFIVIGYLFPLGAKGIIPLDLLIDLVGADRYDSQLTWSNTNQIPRCNIWACTNKYYTADPSAWFQLSTNESSPFVDSAARNHHSVFYRIADASDNTATSRYDVGKMDINIRSNTIAWASFPFTPQSTCQSINDWLEGRFEARSIFDPDKAYIERQEQLGVGYDRADYYIDFDGTTTNFFGLDADSTNLYLGFMYIIHPTTGRDDLNVPAYGMVPTNSFEYQMPYDTVVWWGPETPSTQTFSKSGLIPVYTPARAFFDNRNDYVERQLSPGFGYARSDYCIQLDGTTNFLSAPIAEDYIIPNLGLYIHFSTDRVGTGSWYYIKSY